MNVPVSKRLLLCASLVPHDAKVADVGCDHGYLGIYLLLNRLAKTVVATDLNEMPLNVAMHNAEKFGVAKQMRFACANGLSAVDPAEVDTIVCSGMGGDLIRVILENAPWVRNEKYTLILQPQHAAPAFRKWLLEEGFAILEEEPVFEDGHHYFALKARYDGITRQYSPGQLYVTPQLLRSKSPDLPRYLDHVVSGLIKKIRGMELAEKPDASLTFLQKTLLEIMEMRDQI